MYLTQPYEVTIFQRTIWNTRILRYTYIVVMSKGGREWTAYKFVPTPKVRFKEIEALCALITLNGFLS